MHPFMEEFKLQWRTGDVVTNVDGYDFGLPDR